jgi:hypothetical protein
LSGCVNLGATFFLQYHCKPAMSLKKPVLNEEKGVMTGVPECPWVHGYVLNCLEERPVRVADLVRIGTAEFGFTDQEIKAAGHHFAVNTHVINGEIYWTRPANLFAIWWGKRMMHPSDCQERQSARQGS